MSYTNGLDKPSDYFNTILWTGNGTDARGITGVGFQPDLVWIKERSSTSPHKLLDAIRGATKELTANGTNAEETEATSLQSFDSDGFTVGTNGAVNESSQTYASWNWKAGTAFTNDASATGIGNIDSAGSVSTDAGFSIISYTGNANADNTVAHGLGSVPKMIILKNRSAANNWMVYHASTGAQAPLFLNLDNAAGSGDPDRFKVVPTSSVFTPGSAQEGNGDGNAIIAYCFAEKKGYSKFGSYTGNGSVSDGVFIYTGFKPAWFMCKKTDSVNSWVMFDNKRSSSGGSNEIDYSFTANEADAEETGTTSSDVDFCANGVKIREDNGGVNASGGSYIYMAFAESPFVSSTGVPATAR